MNIHYCDKCGAIIQDSGETNSAQRVGGHSLCGNCTGQEEKPTPTKKIQPSKKTTLSIDNESYSMTSMLKSDSMEMFSSETVARRKKRPLPRESTSLSLVEDDAAEDTRGGAPARPRDHDGPSGPQLDGLAVFDQTLKMTGEFDANKLSLPTASEQPPGFSKFGGTDPSENATTTPTLEASAPIAAPQAAPAPPAPATKIRIECQNCSAKLSVKPVQKRSRLSCPKCTESMVLNPNGEIENQSAPTAPQQVAQFDAQASSPISPAVAPAPAPAPIAQAAPGAPAEHTGFNQESHTADLTEMFAGLGSAIDQDLEDTQQLIAQPSWQQDAHDEQTLTNPAPTKWDPTTSVAEEPAPLITAPAAEQSREANTALMPWLILASAPVAAGLFLASTLLPESAYFILQSIGEQASAAIDQLLRKP